jgi:hypothetical protein
MAINIQSLFSDIIETPAQRQERMLTEGILKGRELTGGLTGLARTQAPLVSALSMQMPQRQEALRRTAGGMLGLDVRTESEKVQDALKGLDIENIDSTRSTAKTLQDMGLGLQAAQLLSLSEQRIAEKAVRERELAVAESQAETAKTRAETAAEQVELGREELQFNETVQEDLVDWREQQVSDLELDRVLKRDELDLRERLAELQQEDLDSRTTAYLQELDVKSSELYEDARQTRALAEEFNAAEAAANYTPGLAGQINEKWKSLTGTPDQESILRTRFNKIINSATMDGLPPGAASDKDIELARQGFPNENYSAEQIASYLAGMQKLSYIAGEKENDRLKFLTVNGGSPAMIDSETNKVVTFNDFWAKKINDPQYITYLEEKTGLDFMDEAQREEYDEQLQSSRRRQLEEEQKQQFELQRQRQVEFEQTQRSVSSPGTFSL